MKDVKNFGSQKGKYTLRDPSKYIGDPENVVFRSSWERAAFVWCERNPKVKRWSSEEVVIPYTCKTDGYQHRYFMDLFIEWTDKSPSIVEIKPGKETKKPRKTKNKDRARHLREVATFVKNTSKWEAAVKYARKRGWSFEIWTEKELAAKGIKKW